jgi:hypothetical protein
MKKLITLILILILVLSAAPVGFSAGPTAGQELRAMGLIAGKAGGDLAENEYLTRTEMMVVLARMLGEFDKASTWTQPSTFTDRSNHWGESYVAYAQIQGWTSGIGAGRFGYNQRHTVREASVFMLKALGYTTPEDFIWEDAFAKASARGLFNGLTLQQDSDILRGDLFRVMKNALNLPLKERTELLGETLGVLIPDALAAQAAQMRQNLAVAPVRIGDKWGYMGPDGKLAIGFLFDDAYGFSEGLALVVIDGKAGYIDKAGRLVIEAKFEEGGQFVNGLAPAKSGGKFGYINKTGAFVIEPKYDFADHFSDGLARVVVSGLIGYISPEGTMVIQPKYTNANRFTNGIAAVLVGSEIGYINKTGTLVIQPQYLITGEHVNGLIRFNADTSVGYMNQTGKVVIPATYVWADNFSEGLAATETTDMRFYYINTSGTRPFSTFFEDAYAFSEGLAFVMKNGRYGVINTSGQFVIQPQFADASSSGFSSGLAAVEVRGKIGYINSSGTMVIAPQFDQGDPFRK